MNCIRLGDICIIQSVCSMHTEHDFYCDFYELNVHDLRGRVVLEDKITIGSTTN